MCDDDDQTNCSFQVIPIVHVTGALGTVSRGFEIKADETVGNALLHGTFATNNLAGVRENSVKSVGHLQCNFIKDRTDSMEYIKAHVLS